MASELTFQFEDPVEDSVGTNVGRPGKLLTLCIPTYNRADCMRQQFFRLLTLSSEELEKIEIIISDNCSTDDTEHVAHDFLHKLPFIYLRNTENLGPDGNFLQCLQKATGRYVWLLGDDDYLRTEHISQLLPLLEETTYGLIHIGRPTRSGNADVFTDLDRYLCKVGIMITFMSSNIFLREPAAAITYERFRKTNLLQVPMYLEAALRAEKNVILHRRYYDAATMKAGNGGYNIMNVFVRNLSDILDEYEERGVPPHTTLIMRNKISDFIFPYIFNLLLLRKESRFDTKGAKQLLNRYLGPQRILLSALKFFISLRFLHICLKKVFKLCRKYGSMFLFWSSWILFPPVLADHLKKICNAFTSFRFSRSTATPAVHSYIEGPVYLKGGKYVRIGRHFSSRPGLRIEVLRRGADEPALIIGDNVTLNFRVHIGVINRITIGNNVLMGSNVLITDHSHGPTDRSSLEIAPGERPLRSKGPVSIGDNVWIGENVVILPGITIGKGAVIGAGAVVTRNIPDFARAAGNPARILADRTSL